MTDDNDDNTSIVIGPALCGFVAVFCLFASLFMGRCSHDNSKLRVSILTEQDW